MGCSKNLVDSEKLMGQLRINNIEVTHQSDQPTDYVVINTCGFIKDAKEESIDTVLNFIEAKKSGLIEKIYVMGCLSERYLFDLKKEFPEVDGIYGVNNMEEIIHDIGANYKNELIGERVITTPQHFAYLKISEGCDRSCSFCAIPLIRGKHKSLPIEQLLDEARQLVDKGVKEIILIAQDLTYYGVDIYGSKQLPQLVEKLSQIKGIEWIRLHYAYPTQFPSEVLHLMNSLPNICHYIDIPLQHISDRILKSMRRGHTAETTKSLIQEFRNSVPDINIRTTLIVGYPGETESEFEELLQFVKESRFDRLGAFTYSPEENTHAFALKDDVDEDLKADRLNRLMELQEQISFEKNQEKVGLSLKVIIDRKEGQFYIGRTQFDSPEVDNEVIIKATKKLKIGDFYQVNITSAEAFDLNAELV
jgi:ribosomal protein S12 methylthiotransferase